MIRKNKKYHSIFVNRKTGKATSSATFMDVLAFLNDDPSDRQGLKSLLNYDRSKALLKKNKIKKVLRKIVTPKNYDDSQKSRKELVIFSQKVREQAKLLLPV